MTLKQVLGEETFWKVNKSITYWLKTEHGIKNAPLGALLISYYADQEQLHGNGFYKSSRVIEDETCINRATVKNFNNLFQRLGWVAIARDGYSGTNTYTINHEKLSQDVLNIRLESVSRIMQTEKSVCRIMQTSLQNNANIERNKKKEIIEKINKKENPELDKLGQLLKSMNALRLREAVEIVLEKDAIIHNRKTKLTKAWVKPIVDLLKKKQSVDNIQLVIEYKAYQLADGDYFDKLPTYLRPTKFETNLEYAADWKEKQLEQEQTVYNYELTPSELNKFNNLLRFLKDKVQVKSYDYSITASEFSKLSNPNWNGTLWATRYSSVDAYRKVLATKVKELAGSQACFAFKNSNKRLADWLRDEMVKHANNFS